MDDPITDVTCPSCGSRLSLISADRITSRRGHVEPFGRGSSEIRLPAGKRPGQIARAAQFYAVISHLKL